MGTTGGRAGASPVHWACLIIVVCVVATALAKGQQEGFQEVTDHKDLKKLMKTKNNLMVVLTETKMDSKTNEMLTKVSKNTKGKGTVVKVNCKEATKLCKKLKVTWKANTKLLLRHYKDGEFHKDYDRPMTEKSLTTFMQDPSGDAPWEEDPEASDVVFLGTPSSLNKALKKDKEQGTLVMFYAPWCGHCKRMKPDYQAAASEVKGKAVMAAMDLNKGGNGPVKSAYNISGFPTLVYFEEGQKKFGFNGRSKAELVEFLSQPYPREEPADKVEETEAAWSEEPSEVAHLTDESFDSFMSSESSVLVMFYAPWCGHCKRMKPEYVKAAATLKAKGIAGKLAAVDTTKERALGKRFDVKGFPTIVYFKDGEKAFDAGDARKEDSIVKFMSDPSEPPPPPPPEKPWSEEENEIEHLSEETFKTALKKKKHYLVMFYAPWCGHCKKAKPELSGAAEELKDNVKVKFGAVDCTLQQGLCQTFGVRGYPTFKYFSYYNKEQKDYDGGRLKDDFVEFMNDPGKTVTPPPPERLWSEDETTNVEHLGKETFESALKEKEHYLVMFYAPWCGHCKRAKPEYSSAAEEMKDNAKVKFGAVDCTQEYDLCKSFGVRGYPTFKYFSFYDQEKKDYDGGRLKADFVKYMKDPNAKAAAPPPPEKPWSEEKTEVEHLTEVTFKTALLEKEHYLVMFYAPWCGHCKRAKPEYSSAAEDLKGNSKVKLGAVDCTQEYDLCKSFGVRGYPTFKYFSYYDQKKKDYDGGRMKADFVRYMKDPNAKAASPPPPEKPWSEEKTQVEHLTEVTFKTALLEKEHYLVMFYAPWCGHCKSAKPEYSSAAEDLKGNAKVKLGAVDCTQEQGLCQTFDIRGYPTFKYFSHYNKEQKDYNGGRKKADFVRFMKDPTAAKVAPSVGEAVEAEEEGSWGEGSEYLLHLHDCDHQMKLRSAEHALVAYYAPWCGHCKSMKADFAKAAKLLAHNRDLSGKSFTIAAVDATVERKAASAVDIRGYPTIKYFKAGKNPEDYKGGRSAKEFHDFLANKILGRGPSGSAGGAKTEL